MLREVKNSYQRKLTILSSWSPVFLQSIVFYESSYNNTEDKHIIKRRDKKTTEEQKEKKRKNEK